MIHSFGTLPTSEGYEVICERTGHAVAVVADYDTAVTVADNLTAAALEGPKVLAKAFGRVYVNGT